jgi:hypothetical protein
MGSPAFEARNREGRAAEVRIAEAFFLGGWFTRARSMGASRDLEVFLPGGVAILEVKNEDNYATSPHLCIEMKQGEGEGRFSGIWASESTHCVHTFGEKCVVYRTQIMRQFIEVRRLSGVLRVEPFARSDNFNRGVLVPKRELVMKTWVDEIDVVRLPQSRVFQLIRK